MLKEVVGKDVAYQEQLGYPDINRYTDIQSKQILKWLMAGLIPKDLKKKKIVLRKGILCTSFYYFPVYMRLKTQRLNKNMEKNNLGVKYNSRWTSVSKGRSRGRNRMDFSV